MASVSQLRSGLLSAFSSRGLQNGEQQLFQELRAHRALLMNIYDVGPRNQQEERELQSGERNIVFLSAFRITHLKHREGPDKWEITGSER